MNDKKGKMLTFFNIMRNRGIFAFFNRFFRGNVHQKNNNCKKSGSDLESRYIICQVNHDNSSSFVSVKTLSFQKIITSARLNINTLKPLVRGIETKNKTTEFEQTVEKTFNWAVVMLNAYPTLTRKILPVNKVRNSLTQQGFLKLTKKTLISTFIIWFVIIGTGIIYLFNPFGTKTAEAVWFNDNWGYRTPINFTHNASDTNKKVKVDIDTQTLIAAGKMQSDCDDSRFTDINGNILDYYIDPTFGVCGTPTNGGPTKINDAGNPGALGGQGRWVVRTTTNVLYSGQQCKIFKSTDNGASWAQAGGTQSSCSSDRMMSAAIDSSDNIHVVYKWDDGIDKQVQYDKFLTSSDAWEGGATNTNLNGKPNATSIDIAVDTNSVPHVVYADNTNIVYLNKVGGTWNAAVSLSDNARQASIAISEDNIPEVSYIDNTNTTLAARLGNANNATSFSSQDLDTTVSTTAATMGTTLAIDSSGNTWVSYIDSDGSVNLIKHNDADAWTSWQAAVESLATGKEPSIAINGTDIYVFFQDSGDDVAYDKYTTSWAGKVVLQTGTFQDVKAKWSFNYNNDGASRIDYLYSDATDISWASLEFASTDYYVLLPTIHNGVNTIYHYFGQPSAVAGKQTAQFAQSTLIPATSSPAVASEEKAPSPTAYWKFDDGGGTATQDATTNNLDGVLDGGSPTYDNASSTSASSVSSVTYSHTVGTGSNRILVVGVAFRNTETSTVSSITYNGVNLTAVTAVNNNCCAGRTELWYLVAPSTGANDIVVTLSGSTSSVVVGATSWFGVAQSSPVRSSNTNFSIPNSTDVTVDVTSVSGDIVLDAWNMLAAGSAIAGGDQTERWDVSIGGGSQMTSGGGHETASGTTTTMSWTLDRSDNWSIAAASFKPYKPTSTSPTWLTEDQCISVTCLRFDGNDDISIANESNFDFERTDKFSVSAWVKPNVTRSGGAANYWIISKRDSTSPNAGWEVGLNWNGSSGTFVRVVLSNTAGTNLIQTGGAKDLANNVWYHVVMTYDGSSAASGVKIYVNGVADTLAVSNDTLSASILNNISPRIGSRNNTTEFFKGDIDEVKVFRDNTERTAAQVKADYNSYSNPEGVSARLGGNTPNNIPGALSNGLTGYWKMDESAANSCTGGANDSCDSSGNANDGAWQADATFTAGKFGNGTTYDGTGDYIQVADNNTLDIGSQITLTGWFNVTDTAANRGIVSKSTEYIVRVESDDKLNFFLYDGVDYEPRLTAATNPSAGAWHHFAAVYDSTLSSNHQKLYVDGVLSAQQDRSITPAGTGSNFIIGEFGSGFFQGTLDDVRIYNRALSNTEVSQLYNFAPGPVGYWKLDEKVGNNAYDSSSNDNTLTWTNTPTSTRGKYGTGINLAGSNQHLIRADDADFDFADDADFSFEAWIKHNTASAQEIIMSKFNEAGYKMIMESDGDITCALDYDSTWTPTDSITSTAATYDDNIWHHIACVKSGASSLSLYIDGVFIGSDSTLTAANAVANTDPLYIGIDADGTSLDFIGQIDEVKIYNYARTAGQVVEDMNAGHPAPGSPVGSAVGYWKMDEGFSTTANDTNSLTGGAENLTLNAASWTNSGKFNKAWNGTGGDFRLSRTTDQDLEFGATDSFAISLWFKTDSATNPANGTEYILDNATIAGAGASTAGYSIYAKTTGVICFAIDDDTTWDPDIESCTTTDYYDATWHYLTAVRDVTADKTYIYIDSFEKDSDADTTTATLDGSVTLFVGDMDTDDNATAGTEEFAGDIDELKIFRSAMTVDQIKLDMNRGSSQVLGALSQSSGSTDPGTAASQEYCVPGDSTSCAGPVGRWNFEEGSGTTANDSSTNGKTATITAGSGGYITGKIGRGYDFDASSTKIQTSSNYSEPNPMTIEAWVYPETSGEGSAGYILGFGTGTTHLAVTSTNDLRFTQDFSGGGSVDGVWTVSSGVTLNAWNQVVLTYDGSATTNNPLIYVNGQPKTVTVTTTPVGTQVTTAAAWVIGNGSGQSNTFDGKIDKVMVFDYIRSPAQVAWDYNRGGPVGYWKMDECQGTTLNDSAGNSLTGTWSGSTAPNTSAGTCSVVDTATAWYNGATGKRNYSLDFDGVDDQVSVTNADKIDFDTTLAPASSFAAWIYADTDGETDLGHVFSKDAGSPSQTYIRVAGESGGRVNVEAGMDLATADATVSVSSAITTGSWNHIVMTYTDDGDDEISLYINGFLRGTSTDGNGVPTTTDTSNLIIGNQNAATDRTFDGKIDDFRVYNYELTATQVKNLMNDGATRFGPVTGAP